MKQPENSGRFTLRNAPFRKPVFTDAFARGLAEKFGLTGLPHDALADQLESAFYFFMQERAAPLATAEIQAARSALRQAQKGAANIEALLAILTMPMDNDSLARRFAESKQVQYRNELIRRGIGHLVGVFDLSGIARPIHNPVFALVNNELVSALALFRERTELLLKAKPKQRSGPKSVEPLTSLFVRLLEVWTHAGGRKPTRSRHGGAGVKSTRSRCDAFCKECLREAGFRIIETRSADGRRTVTRAQFGTAFESAIAMSVGRKGKNLRAVGAGDSC